MVKVLRQERTMNMGSSSFLGHSAMDVSMLSIAPSATVTRQYPFSRRTLAACRHTFSIVKGTSGMMQRSTAPAHHKTQHRLA